MEQVCFVWRNQITPHHTKPRASDASFSFCYNNLPICGWDLATLTSALEGGDLYFGFSLEAGNAWADKKSVVVSDLDGAGSVFLGLETMLGPLYLSYGRAASGDDKVYLLLGRAL